MIPKSGCRFSEKIMLYQEAKAKAIQPKAIWLSRHKPQAG
jgi:hypothetical protein